MTDHEKRIREALEAGPTEGPWLIHDQKGRRWIETHSDDVIAQVYKDGRSNAVFEANASLIAACNPSAIRALLADLDAMRGALKSVQAAIYMDDAGQLRLTRSFDESTIDAALKGASA